MKPRDVYSLLGLMCIVEFIAMAGVEEVWWLAFVKGVMAIILLAAAEVSARNEKRQRMNNKSDLEKSA